MEQVTERQLLEVLEKYDDALDDAHADLNGAEVQFNSAESRLTSIREERAATVHRLITTGTATKLAAVPNPMAAINQ